MELPLGSTEGMASEVIPYRMAQEYCRRMVLAEFDPPHIADNIEWTLLRYPSNTAYDMLLWVLQLLAREFAVNVILEVRLLAQLYHELNNPDHLFFLARSHHGHGHGHGHGHQDLSAPLCQIVIVIVIGQYQHHVRPLKRDDCH